MNNEELLDSLTEIYYKLENKNEIFDLLNELCTNGHQKRAFLKSVVKQDVYNDALFDEVSNVSGNINESYYDSLFELREEFLIRYFETLCECDYFEAKNFLEEFCVKEKHDYLIKNIDRVIKKSYLTFITEDNVDDFNFDYEEKNIDLLHLCHQTNFSPMYCSLIKRCAKFSTSKNLKALSNINIEDLDDYFEFADCRDSLWRFNNYFEIIRYKGLDCLIERLEKVICDNRSGDRVVVLEMIFDLVFDSFFDSIDERIEYFNKMPKNNILANLTRGELQNFLEFSNVGIDIKHALVKSSKVDLFGDSTSVFEIHNNDENLYLDFEQYKEFIQDYDTSIEYRNDLIDSDSTANYELDCDKIEFVNMETYKIISEYQIRNLAKILAEKNLSQKFKWLNEAKNSSVSHLVYETSKENFDNPVSFYYSLMNDVIRKFYFDLGMDYDSHFVNNSLPRTINYGIEYEEEGYKTSNTKLNSYGFNSVYDGSISKVLKGKGNGNILLSFECNSNEYVSEIFESSSKHDLANVMEFAYYAGFCGAYPNNSCGFHIHLSSDYTDNIDVDNYIAKYGLPKNYNPEKFVDDYSDSKFEYEENYRNQGYDVCYRIAKEIFNMQRLLSKKFLVYKERIGDRGYTKYLEYDKPHFSDKNKFVNFRSLMQFKGIEFRFLNLPDFPDKKVIEAYIDFATSYFAYMEEGNITDEYFNDALVEAELDIENMNPEEIEDYKFDLLLSELCLNDDTVKVINNLEKIFELYNCKGIFVDKELNYYDMNDKRIIDESNSEDFDSELE